MKNLVNRIFNFLATVLVITGAISISALPMAASAQPFDQSHAAFSALLKKHVVSIDGGKSSQVKYAELLKDHAQLKTYLDSLSKVSESEFSSWTKPQRMAFLINAYNGFTLELILQNYPVRSIKDIGNVFDDRWKRKFFKLFGQDSYLNKIEHDTLRKPGVFDEPRVHFAVNCASIGCPALREEAFTADKLDKQLEEQTVRFLSDRSRNRYDTKTGKLEVSMIFKWFSVDWESGYKGLGGKTPAIKTREDFFARYAKLLADAPADQQKIADGKAAISMLDYDWSLNGAK